MPIENIEMLDLYRSDKKNLHENLSGTIFAGSNNYQVKILLKCKLPINIGREENFPNYRFDSIYSTAIIYSSHTILYLKYQEQDTAFNTISAYCNQQVRNKISDKLQLGLIGGSFHSLHI